MKPTYFIKTIILIVAVTASLSDSLRAQVIQKNDTLTLSCNSTLHLVFDSQITYLDLSCPDEVATAISPARGNILAIRAKEPFQGQRNLSVLLSEDKFCPYILRFEKDPKESVRDFRSERVAHSELEKIDTNETQISRRINHLGVKKKRLALLCSSISRSTSGNTFLELTLRNDSDEEFLLESILLRRVRHHKLRNTLYQDEEIDSRIISGSLDSKVKSQSSAIISLGKLTLRDDESLCITAFEKGNGRTLSFEIPQKELQRQRRRTYTRP